MKNKIGEFIRKNGDAVAMAGCIEAIVLFVCLIEHIFVVSFTTMPPVHPSVKMAVCLVVFVGVYCGAAQFQKKVSGFKDRVEVLVIVGLMMITEGVIMAFTFDELRALSIGAMIAGVVMILYAVIDPSR